MIRMVLIKVHAMKKILLYEFEHLRHFTLDFRKTISIIGQVQLVKMIMEWKGWAYLLVLLSPLGMVILLSSRFGGTSSGSSLRLVVLRLASFRKYYVLHPKTGYFSYWCYWWLYIFLWISAALLHGQRETLEQVIGVYHIVLCISYISLQCVFSVVFWNVINVYHYSTYAYRIFHYSVHFLWSLEFYC